jgi:hypothetical protein
MKTDPELIKALRLVVQRARRPGARSSPTVIPSWMACAPSPLDASA